MLSISSIAKLDTEGYLNALTIENVEALGLEELHKLMRLNPSKMANWIIKADLGVILHILGLISDDGQRTAEAFRAASNFGYYFARWVSLRVNSSREETDRVLECHPELFARLASDSPFSDIKRRALDVGHFTALASNPTLSRQEAAELSFILADMGRLKMSVPYTSAMSFRYLRDADRLAQFKDEIEKADAETYASLSENWEGSLGDLIKASRELS